MPEPFKIHTGVTAPVDRANVDTDAIVPKQFLRKIERTGFGKHLFHEWRYLDDAGTKPNPDFVLNKPAYKGATVLLARDNFGSGSSREHAPWALADYGFKVIVAPSFADIFANNCVTNGILCVRLKSKDVDELFEAEKASPGFKLTADLEQQSLTAPGGKGYHFEINPFAKHCLLNGLDQIGWTEQFKDKIEQFEERAKTERPWMNP